MLASTDLAAMLLPGKGSARTSSLAEDFDIAAGHIAKGTAPRFEVFGVLNGARGVVLVRMTPVARGPVPELAAIRSARRFIPHRGHRRTVLRHGHLPEQPAAVTAITPAR